MLLAALWASLLGNMLVEKRLARAGYGNKNGKGLLRDGYRNKIDFWCCLILYEILK